MATKRCSKCSAEFTCCNEEGGCWCESLKVPHDNLLELRNKFDNCLCPLCLKEFALSAGPERE